MMREAGNSLSNSILVILGLILSLPVFIYFHKTLPDPDWFFNTDRLLIILVIAVVLFFILKWFKNVVLILLIGLFLFLTYGSINDKYGFGRLYQDYRDLINVIIDSPNPKEIILSRLQPIQNEIVVKNAIDYENPVVRNFAVAATVKYFKEYSDHSDYRQMIQCFAVFKEINSNWNYVNDPESRNYFAKASESVQHLSGDCDDHSILMVACIKAIGGTARIIHTTGHMYPEILIGRKKDLEPINYLIKRKLFPEESAGKSLYYHIDENNQVWLNLDYTAKYPGGPFMDEEILGVLNVEN